MRCCVGCVARAWSVGAQRSSKSWCLTWLCWCGRVFPHTRRVDSHYRPILFSSEQGLFWVSLALLTAAMAQRPVSIAIEAHLDGCLSVSECLTRFLLGPMLPQVVAALMMKFVKKCCQRNDEGVPPVVEDTAKPNEHARQVASGPNIRPLDCHRKGYQVNWDVSQNALMSA